MPLRATEHEEALGMDIVQHGEEAYVTGEGAILIAHEPDGEPRAPMPRSLVVVAAARGDHAAHEHQRHDARRAQLDAVLSHLHLGQAGAQLPHDPAQH